MQPGEVATLASYTHFLILEIFDIQKFHTLGQFFVPFQYTPFLTFLFKMENTQIENDE